MASSWVRGKCIGKGAFGTVNIAVSKSDGRVFAVKSVDHKTGCPGQLEALENEIRILKLLPPSPHVITFLGDDVTCERNGASSFRNLHLEYMPRGTVADLEPADVDERLVRRYAWCLVHALRHLHTLGVVHCDVKGRNVLVAGDGSAVKLADFGSAAEFSGENCGVSPRGSPMWMAPEVVRREYHGPESDVWSLGCTVIEMVTRKPPWEDRGADTLSRIGYSGELPEFPTRLSELGCDFLEKCLRREKSERWSCDQLLQHPFLVGETSSKVVESSPRCVLDWVDSGFDSDEEEEVVMDGESVNSVKGRIGKLATGVRANWESQGWVVVRALASDEEATTITEPPTGDGEGGASWEFGNVAGVESGMEVGTRLEYSGSGRFGTTVKNGRVNRGMWKNERLVWRCNRKGGGCGRSCRYGWEKLDRNRIQGISTNYSLCCKIFKLYYLFFSMFVNKLYFSGILCCLLFTACDKNVVSASSEKERKKERSVCNFRATRYMSS